MLLTAHILAANIAFLVLSRCNRHHPSFLCHTPHRLVVFEVARDPYGMHYGSPQKKMSSLPVI